VNLYAYVNDDLIKNFDHPVVCSNFCKLIRPKSKEIQAFIYCLNQFLYSRKVFFGLENGTTAIQNLDIQSYLYKYSLVIPEMYFIFEFDKCISVALRKIQKNNKQIQTLTQTRDTLLPKLMSGQLRINE
jgi:type I restriction enzyme S subunit